VLGIGIEISESGILRAGCRATVVYQLANVRATGAQPFKPRFDQAAKHVALVEPCLDLRITPTGSREAKRVSISPV